MASYRVQHAAGRRIDDIYTSTRERWGQDLAERYIRGLFARFDVRQIPLGRRTETIFRHFPHSSGAGSRQNRKAAASLSVRP